MNRIAGAALVSALVTSLFGLASSAHATLITFAANLNQAIEVTHLSPPSPGTGQAVIIFDTSAHTLTMNWTFQDLVGSTTDAHIHCCTTVPGVIGGAVVATRNPLNLPGFLGTQGGTFSITLNTALASDWNAPFLNNATNGGNPLTAEATLLAGALAGRAYFNIHSTAVPGGEIAGFLVPEPASLLVFGMGLLGFGFLRRKDRV